jgi:outer membrane protein assembly factor BamB
MTGRAARRNTPETRQARSCHPAGREHRAILLFRRTTAAGGSGIQEVAMWHRWGRRACRALGTAALLAACGAGTPAAPADPPPAGQEWPQWRGPHRDGVWNETGVLSRFPAARLETRWRAPLGSGYCGPTVAGGRVYVMDRVTDPGQQERVHCFDWQTGRPLWSHAYECVYRGIGYPAGPRASVTVRDGRAYALGSMGHLHCLDAASGRVLWKRDLNAELAIRMPTWGVAASPLVEGDLLIVEACGEDACLAAFDRKTGELRWKALPDRGSYSAPIVIDQAGKRVLVCWTGDRVVGLDPATGGLHWQVPHPSRQMPLGIATPVRHGDYLFFTGFYDGSLLLRAPADRLAVEEVWRRRGQNERATDALHSIISTPILLGEHVYGVDSYGELRCLDLKTGERVWESLDVAVPRSRWSTIHFVRNGERVCYEEISRAHLIRPTLAQLPQRGGVCWSHPAFAYRHVFARNDEEIVCASLAAP